MALTIRECIKGSVFSSEVSPVWALEVHDRLWSAYVADSDQLGKGISAMPSIHVATSVLFALTAWRVSRVLGAVLWGYAAVVMIRRMHGLAHNVDVDEIEDLNRRKEVRVLVLELAEELMIGRDRVVAEETPSQMCSARWLTANIEPLAVCNTLPAPA